MISYHCSHGNLYFIFKLLDRTQLGSGESVSLAVRPTKARYQQTFGEVKRRNYLGECFRDLNCKGLHVRSCWRDLLFCYLFSFLKQQRSWKL